MTDEYTTYCDICGSTEDINHYYIMDLDICDKMRAVLQRYARQVE